MTQLRIDRQNPSLWIATIRQSAHKPSSIPTRSSNCKPAGGAGGRCRREGRRLSQCRSRLLPRSLGRSGRQEEDGGDAAGTVRAPSLASMSSFGSPGLLSSRSRRYEAAPVAPAAGFALACDMRFASLERAILGQFEVGVGAVPGGNPMVRLAGLMGRGRAMEVVLGADDFSGCASRSATVTSIAPCPMANWQAFVDRPRNALAGFEKHAIVQAKALLDLASLPPDAAFPPALGAPSSSPLPGQALRLAWGNAAGQRTPAANASSSSRSGRRWPKNRSIGALTRAGSARSSAVPVVAGSHACSLRRTASAHALRPPRRRCPL